MVSGSLVDETAQGLVGLFIYFEELAFGFTDEFSHFSCFQFINSPLSLPPPASCRFTLLFYFPSLCRMFSSFIFSLSCSVIKAFKVVNSLPTPPEAGSTDVHFLFP